MRTPSRLPIIAVGAAATILVVVGGCSESGEPPTRVAAPDTADQVLFGMEHNLTIDGVLRVRLRAERAHFYQGPQSADLYDLTVRFYSPHGAVSSTVTADSGTYHWRTGDMDAQGDVVAVTPDGRRLTTSVLRYDKRTDEISGPAPFVFDAPDRHLEGDGFTADPEFRNVVAQRPRRGTVRDIPPPDQ